MTTGEKILHARKARGLTQEALANALGVSRQSVAKWEKGAAMPGTAHLFALSECLQLPLEELSGPPATGGEKEASSPPPPAGNAADTAKDKPLRQPFHWGLLWGCYALFLFGLLMMAGSGWPVLCTVFFILLAGAVFLARFLLRSEPPQVGPLLRAAAFLLAALLAAFALWAVVFCFRARYHHRAVWSLPREEWGQYQAVAAWVEEHRALGPGVYAQQLPTGRLPEGTVYLVYRYGVTDGGAGTVRRNPLRLRFTVDYRKGDAAEAVDLLVFEAAQDFQVFFSVGGSDDGCCFTTDDTILLTREAESLLHTFGGL